MSVKQVIVIRRDLAMRRGKEIAQGAHASAMWLLERLKQGEEDRDLGNLVLSELYFSPAEEAWIRGDYRKVVVQVQSLEELDQLYHLAIHNGLTTYKVVDLGATEFKGVPTVTALAIGPNNADAIDFVTRHLKLY